MEKENAEDATVIEDRIETVRIPFAMNIYICIYFPLQGAAYGEAVCHYIYSQEKDGHIRLSGRLSAPAPLFFCFAIFFRPIPAGLLDVFFSVPYRRRSYFNLKFSQEFIGAFMFVYPPVVVCVVACLSFLYLSPPPLLLARLCEIGICRSACLCRPVFLSSLAITISGKKIEE